MTTVRQMERRWNSRAYGRLFRELVSARPEASLRLELELGGQATAAAAMTIIRLDELDQPHVPLYGRLARELLGVQQADGGWGDPMITALCLRALRCCRGQGPSIDRGLHYLASLQKSEGIWPREPIQRMAADPYTSAFILFELGADEAFRAAVRFDQAIAWFEQNESTLDGETRRLWDRAAARCQVYAIDTGPQSVGRMAEATAGC